VYVPSDMYKTFFPLSINGDDLTEAIGIQPCSQKQHLPAEYLDESRHACHVDTCHVDGIWIKVTGLPVVILELLSQLAAVARAICLPRIEAKDLLRPLEWADNLPIVVHSSGGIYCMLFCLGLLTSSE
jgi:hypothetical protein